MNKAGFPVADEGDGFLELDVKSMTLTELQALFSKMDLPSYRAKQVFAWLQKKGAMSYEEMTDLPKSLAADLTKIQPIYGCTLQDKQISLLDGTTKFLFSLHDGCLVESVLMHYKYGYSLCISSQAGCKMGCVFCASTRGGFVRNLQASELLGQIQAAQRESGVRISHVVLMGMGEPLDNYDSVLRFLKLVNDPQGLQLSMRNLSLSTCGVVPRIYALAEEKLQLTLSVSLHAPNDKLRSEMMPVNKRYPLAHLLNACRHYAAETSRRISFEYTMLANVNDSAMHAKELALLLQGLLCHVNLIPVNPVSKEDTRPSPRLQMERFQTILQREGISTTIRRTLGADIDAACGLLRLRKESVVAKQ